jgi:hypothetical protein
MANPLSQPPGSAVPSQPASGTSGADLPRVLTSAPANLPVAVRISFARYVFTARRAEAILTIVMGLFMIGVGVGLIVEPDQTIHSERYGDMDGHFVGWAGLVFGAFLFGMLTVSAKRKLKDGFAAGADHTGAYIRPNLDRTRVVFIPWAGVAGVRVAKWHGPQLVVQPRDRVIESAFELEIKGQWEARAGARMAQRRRMTKLGTNIHAPIPGVDVAELLNNLRYYAAGRAPIQQ